MATFFFRATKIVLCGCLLWGGTTIAFADITIEQVAPGIYYGGAPKSESDYRRLQALGIKTVVDLRKFKPRKTDQSEHIVPAYGVAFQHIPMGFWPSRDDSPEGILQVMADPGIRPIYVHCMLGRDRTALLVALYRVRYLGWTRDAAYAAMQSNRFNRLLRDLDRYFWQHAG
jgi:tyrosine-protein phosphatase SIW14